LFAFIAEITQTCVDLYYTVFETTLYISSTLCEQGIDE
jgi:hypothetical protein